MPIFGIAERAAAICSAECFCKGHSTTARRTARDGLATGASLGKCAATVSASIAPISSVVRLPLIRMSM